MNEARVCVSEIPDLSIQSEKYENRNVNEVILSNSAPDNERVSRTAPHSNSVNFL